MSLPGIVDVDTTLRLDKPELLARIDRERAAALASTHKRSLTLCALPWVAMIESHGIAICLSTTPTMSSSA